MINWISEEEQYQEHLNIEQISRIQDFELREIRSRHWHYRKRILQDEYNISDEKFIKLCKEDWEQEKEEIEKYKKTKEKSQTKRGGDIWMEK